MKKKREREKGEGERERESEAHFTTFMSSTHPYVQRSKKEEERRRNEEEPSQRTKLVHAPPTSEDSKAYQTKRCLLFCWVVELLGQQRSQRSLSCGFVHLSKVSKTGARVE